MSTQYSWIKFIIRCLEHDATYHLSDAHNVFLRGEQDYLDIIAHGQRLHLPRTTIDLLLVTMHNMPRTQTKDEK